MKKTEQTKNNDKLEINDIDFTKPDDDTQQYSPKFFDPNNDKQKLNIGNNIEKNIVKPAEDLNEKKSNNFLMPPPKKVIKTYETQKGKEEREYSRKSPIEFSKRMIENKDPIGVMAGGGLRPITMEEVEKHDTEKSLWTVIDGKVFDLTTYLDYHPGGAKKLMLGAGCDCTSLFRN